MKTDSSSNPVSAVLDPTLSSNLLKTIIEGLPIRAYIKDNRGRFIVANQAVADFVGVASVAEVIGKTDFNFFPKELAGEYFTDEQKIIETGQPIVNKEEPKVDRTGSKRMIFVTKLPIKDNKGDVKGILGFSADVTEHRLAEMKLHEERNFLRTLIDTLPDYIYAKDTQSRFVLSNTKHAEHMNVGSPDDLMGKTDFDFYAKDVATSFFADEQHIIKTGAPVIGKDEINVTLDGHTVRVLTTKIPLKDTEGKITAIVGVGHDISALTMMERDLRDANRKLVSTLDELKRTQEQVIQSERLRALGQMASGITHDFNNALTPILGYSDLLLNTPGTLNNRDAVQGMLKDIRTAATDAAQTVRRLSEFYAPARKTERKVIELGKLVDSTLALTRPFWKEEMTAKGINIQVVTRTEDAANVFGNEPQLREMLTNLIFNAAEAMPKGGTLTISARKEPPLATIEIADTGTGMTEEVQRRCFEPFFTTKRKRGGGLGLSMVHGIVRQHGGDVEVRSVEGKGTTVIVRIPETSAPVEQNRPEPVQQVEVSRLNVLLIDDEEIVLQTIDACLRSDKHTVSTAHSGKEGLEIFMKGSFDVVITDRAMPGVSGDHVATEIRKANPNVPIIMLTGFGHVMKDLHRCPAGVDLLVSKPVTRDLLRDAIVKVLASKKSQAVSDKR